MNETNSNVLPKEQCEIIKKLREEMKINEGDDVYLISSSWFKKWQKHVDYYNKESASKSYKCGEIDNSDLIWQKKFDSTKKIRVDYIVVSKEIWDQLLSWYGGGPQLKFPVIDTGKEFIPNDEPMTLTILYKNAEKNITTNKNVYTSQFKKQIYNLFAIPSKTETKLVDYWNDSYLKYLNEDTTISANSIYDKQKVLVCRKHKNGKYKFDDQSQSYSYSPWNQGSAPGPGIVGFNNLGNTCYFNSGTQCLVHSSPLIQIFLHSDWRKDLNFNNPIGMKGELAIKFSELMNEVWCKHPKRCVSPSELKSVIGRNIPQFNGYDQQDSQELITFMLDGLHEDLNRCKNKPQLDSLDGDGTNDEQIAMQSWENFKKRNDSVIVDNFYGQFRSSLDCPNCKKKTVIFDSFNIISLPISMPKMAQKDLIFVPADYTHEYKKISISVPAGASLQRISSEVSKEIGRKVNVIVGSEGTYSVNWGLNADTYQSSYYYNYYKSTAVTYAFEVPDEYEGKFLVPCKIQISIKYYYSTRDEDAAGPILVPVSSVDATEDEIAEEATKILKCLWQPCDKPIPSQCQQLIEKNNDTESSDDSDSSYDQTAEKQKTENVDDNKGEDANDNKDEKADGQKNEPESIKPRFNATIYTGYTWNNQRSLSADQNNQNLSSKITNLKIKPEFYASQTGFSYNSLFRHYDEINETSTTANSSSQEDSDSVKLSQCFKFFSTPDILDEDNKWFCPKCREFVCANKKMDIWKVPNCLILHLKRFISNEYHTRKDETLVHFPEIINLKDYIIGPQKDQDMFYKLYAVSEHSGYMGGGHYTAHAKVVKYGHKDGPWYYFNDSSASQSNYEDTQNREAYVLFYQKYDPSQNADVSDEQQEEEEEEKKEKEEDSDGYCDSVNDDDDDSNANPTQLRTHSSLFRLPSQSSSSSSSSDDDFKKRRYGNMAAFNNSSSSSSDSDNPYGNVNELRNNVGQYRNLQIPPYGHPYVSTPSSSDNDEQVVSTNGNNHESSIVIINDDQQSTNLTNQSNVHGEVLDINKGNSQQKSSSSDDNNKDSSSSDDNNKDSSSSDDNNKDSSSDDGQKDNSDDNKSDNKI